MKNISSVINIEEFEKNKIKSRRTDLIKQLYELYISEPEKTKKENRKRYYNYIRLYHNEALRKKTFNKNYYDSFKSEFKSAKLPKDQKFLKYLSPSFFAIKFSHLKGDQGIEALSYILSVAKDKKRRKENFEAFILGSIKPVDN